jgi:hypothetical protein
MTQPDGLKPEGGISSSGLSDFAGKTQYDWQSAQRQTMFDRFSPAQRGFLSLFGDINRAQQSANFANKTNLVTFASTLAGAVSGGVAVSDTFSGSAASTLGSSWSRSSGGPGAGTWGPNGSGSVTWTHSGNSYRMHMDRYNTPLSTEFQAVMTILSTNPQSALTNNGFNYLFARMNSSKTTFIWVRIGTFDIKVGNCVSGSISDPTSWNTFWDKQTTKNVAGDQIVLLCGTNASRHNFIVLKNGYSQIDYTDTTSSPYNPATYGYVGMGARAEFRLAPPFQTMPGNIDVFAAADRQPSTT